MNILPLFKASSYYLRSSSSLTFAKIQIHLFNGWTTIVLIGLQNSMPCTVVKLPQSMYHYFTWGSQESFQRFPWIADEGENINNSGPVNFVWLLLNSRFHGRNKCPSQKRETQCLSRDPAAPNESVQGLPGALEEFLDLGKNRGAQQS